MAVEDGTVVVLADGSTKFVQDLLGGSPFDLVQGFDGTVRQVVSVTPLTSVLLYQVEMDDGEFFVVTPTTEINEIVTAIEMQLAILTATKTFAIRGINTRDGRKRVMSIVNYPVGSPFGFGNAHSVVLNPPGDFCIISSALGSPAFTTGFYINSD